MEETGNGEQGTPSNLFSPLRDMTLSPQFTPEPIEDIRRWARMYLEGELNGDDRIMRYDGRKRRLKRGTFQLKNEYGEWSFPWELVKWNHQIYVKDEFEWAPLTGVVKQDTEEAQEELIGRMKERTTKACKLILEGDEEGDEEKVKQAILDLRVEYPVKLGQKTGEAIKGIFLQLTEDREALEEFYRQCEQDYSGTGDSSNTRDRYTSAKKRRTSTTQKGEPWSQEKWENEISKIHSRGQTVEKERGRTDPKAKRSLFQNKKKPALTGGNVTPINEEKKENRKRENSTPPRESPERRLDETRNGTPETITKALQEGKGEKFPNKPHIVFPQTNPGQHITLRSKTPGTGRPPSSEDDDRPTYTCRTCSRTFSSERERDEHQRTCRGDQTWTCEQCYDEFADEKGLREHRDQCPVRREKLGEERGMAQRRSDQRTPQTPKRKEEEQNYVEREDRTPRRNSLGRSRQTPGRSRKESRSPLENIRREIYYQDSGDESEDEGYEGTSTRRPVRSGGSTPGARRRNLDPEDHRCQRCMENFGSEAAATRHQETCVQGIPEDCPQCGLNFPNMRARNQHLTSECRGTYRPKIQRCPFCKEIIGGNLTIHMRTCSRNPRATPDRGNKCPFCGDQIEEDMREHIRYCPANPDRRHRDKNKKECNFCKQYFTGEIADHANTCPFNPNALINRQRDRQLDHLMETGQGRNTRENQENRDGHRYEDRRSRDSRHEQSGDRDDDQDEGRRSRNNRQEDRQSGDGSGHRDDRDHRDNEDRRSGRDDRDRDDDQRRSRTTRSTREVTGEEWFLDSDSDLSWHRNPHARRRESRVTFTGLCPYCEMVMADEADLREHLMTCNQRPLLPGQERCPDCQQVFPNSRLEVDHRTTCPGRTRTDNSLGLAGIRRRSASPARRGGIMVRQRRFVGPENMAAGTPVPLRSTNFEGHDMYQHLVGQSDGLAGIINRLIELSNIPDPDEKSNLILALNQFNDYNAHGLAALETNSGSVISKERIYIYLHPPVFHSRYINIIDPRDTRHIDAFNPKPGQDKDQTSRKLEQFLRNYFTCIRNKKATEESAIETLMLKIRGTAYELAEQKRTELLENEHPITFRVLCLTLIGAYLDIDPKKAISAMFKDKKELRESWNVLGVRLTRKATMATLNEPEGKRAAMRDNLRMSALTNSMTPREEGYIHNLNKLRHMQRMGDMNFAEMIENLQNKNDLDESEYRYERNYIRRAEENIREYQGKRDRNGGDRRRSRENTSASSSDDESPRRNKTRPMRTSRNFRRGGPPKFNGNRFQRQRVRRAEVESSETSEVESEEDVMNFMNEEDCSDGEIERIRIVRRKFMKSLPTPTQVGVEVGACFSCGQFGHRFSNKVCPYTGCDFKTVACPKCKRGAHGAKDCKNIPSPTKEEKEAFYQENPQFTKKPWVPRERTGRERFKNGRPEKQPEKVRVIDDQDSDYSDTMDHYPSYQVWETT